MLSRFQAGTLILIAGFAVNAQTDWPFSGHDPGGTRFSPLKQIDSKNVDRLRLAWEFDTLVEDAPASTPPAGSVSPVETYGAGARPAAPTARRPRRRSSEEHTSELQSPAH